MPYIGGGYIENILYISLFSLASGVLYCIIAGLMAVDIVPRKATGAALGIVGISSYVAAGIQDIVSGHLIEKYAQLPKVTEGLTQTQILSATVYDFLPASIFWIVCSIVAFVLPVVFWNKMKR